MKFLIKKDVHVYEGEGVREDEGCTGRAKLVPEQLIRHWLEEMKEKGEQMSDFL